MASAAQTSNKSRSLKVKGSTQEFVEILDIAGDLVVLRDGSCATVIEATAVNFDLLSPEEQEATIAAFSALLNSLSFPIQIVIHSKRLDLSSYARHLNDLIQTQSNHMLKAQMENYLTFVQNLMQQNTILDKRFYIAVSFSPLELGTTSSTVSLFKKGHLPLPEEELVKRASTILKPKRDQVLQMISRMGLKGTILSGSSLLSLFYTIYNPDAQKAFQSVNDLKNGQSLVPDLIAPPAVEVDFNSIKVGDYYYRTLFVVGYPRFISPNWLSPLISFEHTLDIAMFCYPIESGDVLSDLKRKIAEMEATLSSQIQEGKEIDPQTRAALDDALSLQDELVKGTERFFQFGLYITIPARDPKELEEITKRVLATLSSLLVIAKPATLQMEDGFKTTLPLGLDRLLITRNMDTTSLATTIPFTSSQLSSNEGILYGVNQHNGSLVIFNRFTLENANSLILGKSGGGKSFLVKLEAVRSLMLGTEIIIIDPESEYLALCQAVGGEYLSFSGSFSKFINPFDLSQVVEEGENSLMQKILSLHGLMNVMMGSLNPAEKAVLDKAFVLTYKNKGITQDPPTQRQAPPVMEDLYNTLIKLPEAEAKSMAARLERFVKGSLAGLFNQQSSMDIKNPFTVFSLRELEEELRPIAMHIVLDFIWTKVRKDIKKRLLIVDEAWYLMKYQDSASFLFSIAKRARKYGLGLTAITQDTEDFLGSEYGRAIVTNSSMQILLKQSPAAIELIGKTFNLSQGERYLLLNTSIGQGLFFAGSNHVAIKIVASPHEQELITSQPGAGQPLAETPPARPQAQAQDNLSSDLPNPA